MRPVVIHWLMLLQFGLSNTLYLNNSNSIIAIVTGLMIIAPFELYEQSGGKPH